MDRVEHQATEADGAERAFEALRAEVAELRGVVVALAERVPRPGRAATTASAAAPDYSPTLGVMPRPTLSL